MTTQEIFTGMQERLQDRKDKLAGMNAVFQFDLSGDDGGTWHVAVENGEGTVAAGAHANPGVTILMTADDFKQMIAGQLNATAAFMSGKLKIKGDMGLAMRLQTLLA